MPQVATAGQISTAPGRAAHTLCKQTTNMLKRPADQPILVLMTILLANVLMEALSPIEEHDLCALAGSKELQNPGTPRLSNLPELVFRGFEVPCWQQ